MALHYLQSVIFQEFSGVSVAPDLESEILWGSDAIHETVASTKFRISANSFFQVNTVGSERLLEVIKSWCDACKNTYGKDVDVVDVCCGTGSIGLSLSRWGVNPPFHTHTNTHSRTYARTHPQIYAISVHFSLLFSPFLLCSPLC